MPPLNPPLKSPPTSSARSLLQTQRLFSQLIMHPLTPAYDSQKSLPDGRPAAHLAATIIKPNHRLTSFERIEIYNKQYWFRLFDCFTDDFPGLHAILGEKKFHALSRAYLHAHPSRSFSLRNLGQFLLPFLQSHPQLTAPHTRLARDMARFEWAQIEAFDGSAREPLAPADIARISANPARAKLSLQPYLQLLHLHYPLDDYLLALKKKTAALRSEASNAVAQSAVRRRPKALRRPRPASTHLAVHRFQNILYYKRLTPEAFATLQFLRLGKPLPSALAAALAQSKSPHQNWPKIIHAWFDTWTRLHWLCRP